MRSKHLVISGAISNRTSRASTPPSFASSPSSVHSMESIFNYHNNIRGSTSQTSVPSNASSLSLQSRVNNKGNNNYPHIDCFLPSNCTATIPSPLPSPATSIASTTSSSSSSHFSFPPSANTVPLSHNRGPSFTSTNIVHNNTIMYNNVAQQKPTVSSGALFVGDLSFFCTELELAQLFSRFGTIDNLEIKRGRHGDSLMHGFVEFVHVDDAERAMQVLDGFQFMGRHMRVYFITHEKVAPRPDSDTWIQVHVNFISLNLSQKVTEVFLETVFTQFGELADIQVKRHLSSAHQISGYAFVYFLNIYDALKAIFTLKNHANIAFEQVYFECCLSYKAEQFLHQTLQHLQQQEQQRQLASPNNSSFNDNNSNKFVVLQTLANAIQRQQTSNPSAFFKRFEHLNPQSNHHNNNLINNNNNNNIHRNFSDTTAFLSSVSGYHRPPLPPAPSSSSWLPSASSPAQRHMNHSPNNATKHHFHHDHLHLHTNYFHGHPHSFRPLTPLSQAVPSAADAFVPSHSVSLSVAPPGHQKRTVSTDAPTFPRHLGYSGASDNRGLLSQCQCYQQQS